MATVAVLGGGNGGFAAAAHLTRSGHRVQLYNRSKPTIEMVQRRGGIRYRGVMGEGFAPVPVITTHLAAALSGADLVLICLPAIAFEELSIQLASLLSHRPRPIILNPGSTGGALVVRHFLTESGCTSLPPIGETNTLTYICRKQAEDEIYISSLVKNVRFATLGEKPDEALIGQAKALFPSLVPVSHVLHTSLSNLNAILHPPGVILAAAWIEHSHGDFRYYYDAATPAVAQVMAALDGERLTIGSAWGLSLEPLPQLFAEIGSTSAEAGASGSYLRMLRESAPNKFIKAPPALDHRYMNEDIPFGLVPMSALGRATQVNTPVMDSLITLASTINGTDYRKTGWIQEHLGLNENASRSLRN